MRHLKLLVVAAAIAALAAPAGAFAWQITVRVHGAGMVQETTPRALMNCSVSPDGKSESTITQCVAGTPTGGYASGDIVNLRASVPAAAFSRGWRFLRWVDGSGSGQINCDPQGTTGNHTSVDCQFQIWENLYVDLYFDDVEGPQDTSISSGPPSLTAQTTASFTFNSGDPDAGYDCRLDRPAQPAGSWFTCGTPFDKSESFSGLTANGQYTFHVRGRDPSGNVDATPATRTWTVDTVPPTPSITGGPANLSHTSQTSASFTLGTSDGSLSCTLNGAGTACAPGVKSFSDLGDGSYTLVVRATDAAGNAAQAQRTWTVDTTPPGTSLTPSTSGTSRTATFTFAGSDTNLDDVQCRLTGGAAGHDWISCASPREYVGLADGDYVFSVRAVDRAGNVDPTPAEHAWTVDLTAPAAPAISSGPSGLVRSANASFAFTAEAGATFECSLDGGPFQPCSSPQAYIGLAQGAHTFQVRAVDTNDNESAPASRSWTVDTTKPQTTIKAKPPKTTRARKATFRFVSSEAASTFQCKLDRGAWKACKSPKAYANVKPGRHTFRVRAKDRAGNVDATPAAYTWTIRR